MGAGKRNRGMGRLVPSHRQSSGSHGGPSSEEIRNTHASGLATFKTHKHQGWRHSRHTSITVGEIHNTQASGLATFTTHKHHDQGWRDSNTHKHQGWRHSQHTQASGLATFKHTQASAFKTLKHHHQGWRHSQHTQASGLARLTTHKHRVWRDS